MRIRKPARSWRSFPRSGMAAVAFGLLLVNGAQAADVQRGGTIYSSHCAICHGANGTPVMPGAPNFRRMEGLMRSDMQVVNSIRNGKGSMPAFFGVLREREMLDVIAYLRTLS